VILFIVYSIDPPSFGRIALGVEVGSASYHILHSCPFSLLGRRGYSPADFFPSCIVIPFAPLALDVCSFFPTDLIRLHSHTTSNAPVDF